MSITQMNKLLDDSEITDLHKQLAQFVKETPDYADLTSSIADFMLVKDGYLQGDTFDDGRDCYEEGIPDKYENPKVIFIGQTPDEDDDGDVHEEDKAMYFIIINQPDIPLLSWSVPNYYDLGDYVIEHGSMREFLATVKTSG